MRGKLNRASTAAAYHANWNMHLSFLSRLFRAPTDRQRYQPLYDAIIARGRDPSWYRAGQVPDTVTGRFDMIAMVMALVLIRIESEGREGMRATALLTEIFVQDMEGSIRQMGIGDLVVSKHLGRMMSALGGRLGALRRTSDLEATVRRNIFHEAPPSESAVETVSAMLQEFRERLAAMPAGQILEGELPQL